MFKNKVVWITGASSGIGEALALQFAHKGAKLILSSRREDELNRVKQACVDLGAEPENIMLLPLDVTQIDTLVNKAEQACAFDGHIDILINNAGISQRSTFLDTSLETYRTIFEIDFFGQVALTKAVVPMMIEYGSGHVVVTSSVAGKMGVPYRTGYCAVKHAVMGFFDALRTEVTRHNIKVSTITPGFINTNVSKNAIAGDGSIFNQQDTSIGEGMDVHDCAKVILKGLSKGKPEIVVGEGIEMRIVWLKRLLPRLVFKLMERQFDIIAKTNNIKS